MPQQLILMLHSGLRRVDEAAVLESIADSVRRGSRNTIEIDTQQFAETVAVGEWSGHHAFLQSKAAEVRRAANSSENPELHYAGLAEIPHVIAFGAALGDERAVVVHEYDRDLNSWNWPTNVPVIPVVIDNPIGGPIVTTTGIAVLRISISAVIQDADVRDVVGDEVLADVTIRFETGDASTAKVRSEAQVLAIRERIREALAAIKNFRPNVQTLHLFVAAPNSICFVLGQELVPRNSPPVQTYTYRPNAGETAFQPAILISGEEPDAALRELADEEIALAARLRVSVWKRALEQLKAYAIEKRRDRTATGSLGGPWYAGLAPEAELSVAAPFQSLPSIYDLIDQRDDIHPVPYYQDYGHDPEQHLWRISDALILGMYRASGEDEARLIPLLRLFFLHEYVHAYHSLTKYTAANVGKFANALERLDYTADTFAILHDLDFRTRESVLLDSTPFDPVRALADQVDQILRSFWAFDGSGPHERMQVRRIRRYLNWYWRLAQLRRAPTIQDAVSLFSQNPVVEIAGLRLTTDGERRVFAHFQRARTTRSEIAIVLENEKLIRLTDSDSTVIDDLLTAFRTANHDTLVAWFRPVYERAKEVGEVYRSRHPLLDIDATN